MLRSRAEISSEKGPFLPAVPCCVNERWPPKASSEIVNGGDDGEKSSENSDVVTLAFSIEKRVGLPPGAVGRVLTRMFEKLTPTPQAGPADSISTSKPCAAARLMATSLARS